MRTAQLFSTDFLQGEEMTSFKAEDQRGLTGFTTTWDIRLPPQTQWQEGDSPSWPNHTVRLQHEEVGYGRPCGPRITASTTQRQQGSSEAGHDAGQGISRLSDKNGPPISNHIRPRICFLSTLFWSGREGRKRDSNQEESICRKELIMLRPSPHPTQMCTRRRQQQQLEWASACVLHYLCPSSRSSRLLTGPVEHCHLHPCFGQSLSP